ncbi:MAG: ATP phosphoribosyltransferase [Mariprofundales bacterium]
MSNSTQTLDISLVIALAKGRILEETMPLLAKAGYTANDDVFSTRKLMIDGRGGIDGAQKVRFLLIRASDVCAYVARGAADVGIVGRDTLLELQPNVYQPLDLGIGACRMCLAAPANVTYPFISGSRVRVATKYDLLTQKYFQMQDVEADIIHLYGSMELAPLTGIADCIIDLVSSGNTLKANKLFELDCLYNISSRLIVNPASQATRSNIVQHFIEHLRAELT